MQYVQAIEKDSEMLAKLIQDTVKTIYSKYYPEEVVRFFLKLHSKEAVRKDIKSGNVWVLFLEDVAAGTGSFSGSHITRVYVSPYFQRKGIGSYIMNQLEAKISRQETEIILDSSLPACSFYEKRGYITIEHRKHILENGTSFTYDVMKKNIISKN